MSKAKQLAQAIYDRVSTIRVANGFATDIGLCVLEGKLTFDESLVPCVVIAEGDDDVLDQKALEARVTIQFAVEGHDVCDPDRPNLKVHDIVSDLKRAIFGGDCTFGGLVRPSRGEPGLHYRGRSIGERQDGSKLVAAGILFDCEIVENLANP